MDKEKIATLLEENNQKLLDWLEHQEPEKWQYEPDGQWTMGQHALHLLQCIKPINDFLSMPKFLLRFKFGKSDSTVRDYETIVNRYHEHLREAKEIHLKSSSDMKMPKLKDKSYILARLLVENKKLQYKIRKLSVKNLDTLIVPHPLMGKMPVRELIMWLAYHIAHHTKILQEHY